MVIRIMSPIIPIPFFKIADEPITVSTASDRKLPTMGTKVSTANFAVLMVKPSMLVDSP